MTAVVLAGGRSRRLQMDKAFLDIGGKRLIQYVLDVVAQLFSSVLINSNCPEKFQEWDWPIVPDFLPDKGALGGIYTALKHASTDYVFCVACDMPLLNPGLIEAMMRRAPDCDALIPQTPDGFHPLHAIYATRCLPAIEALLQADRLKISQLFPLVTTHYFAPDEIRLYDPHYESFLNVNTWHDVEMARLRLRGEEVKRLRSSEAGRRRG